MKRRKIALMVMVDALGGRFLRGHNFLPEMQYRASLRTVLGFSCACQPTLLSGKLPAENGHGAMYIRRAEESVLDAARPFDRLPTFLAENHRVRAKIYGRVASRINGYFSLYDVPTRLLPHFDLSEQRRIFWPGGLNRAMSIFDRLVELGLEFRSYDWSTPELENLQACERDIRSQRVDYIFLYLPGLDGLLHAHGPGGSEVLKHLSWYESRLRRLLHLADEYADHCEFFLFSDHGMSPVHGGIDLISKIEPSMGRNGKRYLAFYDSTMARFWYEDERVGSELVSLLSQVEGGRLIPEDERAELGVRFSDRSQGDLLFVVQEGLLILPSYMGKQMLAGMHGYHPDAQHADACLLGSYAPDLGVSHIRDLYRLMDSIAVSVKDSKE